MKKVGIVTLYGNANYGNKLQNYAVQETLKKFNLEPITIKNRAELNKKDKYILRYTAFLLRYIYNRCILKNEKYTDNEFNQNLNRTKSFLQFDSLIKTSNSYFNYFNKRKYSNYDYYCVGSDQVWNPNYGGMSEFDLLEFVSEDKVKFSFSASLGVSSIDEKTMDKAKYYLKKFDGISVREETGKKILKKYIENNVDVLIDPTMLLTCEEWQKIELKPKMIKNNKFILTYFLGKIGEQEEDYIEKIAKDNDCIIVNLLDKNSSFYSCGPSEFVWLEHHAFLICTDSFHSCVFSIIFNNPFIVFERKDNLKSMNSRIENLLSKFKLSNRKYHCIKYDDIKQCDFSIANSNLKLEQKKTYDFLYKVIKENN